MNERRYAPVGKPDRALRDGDDRRVPAQQRLDGRHGVAVSRDRCCRPDRSPCRGAQTPPRPAVAWNEIPGTFTSGSESNPDTAVIAAAITNVAHHYGKRVVIEGVECPAMARRAKLIGIEYAQGWHFGRPMPPADRVTAALPA